MSNNRYCEQCVNLNEHLRNAYCPKIDSILYKEKQTKQYIRGIKCFEDSLKQNENINKRYRG